MRLAPDSAYTDIKGTIDCVTHLFNLGLSLRLSQRIEGDKAQANKQFKNKQLFPFRKKATHHGANLVQRESIGIEIGV
ncbi:MAG: hypothetical protein WCS52_03345 [bacterium]